MCINCHIQNWHNDLFNILCMCAAAWEHIAWSHFVWQPCACNVVHFLHSVRFLWNKICNSSMLLDFNHFGAVVTVKSSTPHTHLPIPLCGKCVRLHSIRKGMWMWQQCKCSGGECAWLSIRRRQLLSTSAYDRNQHNFYWTVDIAYCFFVCRKICFDYYST